MSLTVMGTAVGCDDYSQITVAHVTLPKAVLSTAKIFAVWMQPNSNFFPSLEQI